MTPTCADTLRASIALFSGIVLCILVVTPLALAIKYYDWGVSLVFVAPFLIWLLLRTGKALERWARKESNIHQVDPDFPDEPL